MGFREKLPLNCPPKNAHTNGCAEAFRFVPNDKPIVADFESNAAKAEVPPGIDPCRWSSCSLYADMATVQKKRKLKNLQHYAFVAKIKIQPDSGHIVQESAHIDFWMFDTFDPVAAIVQVEVL